MELIHNLHLIMEKPDKTQASLSRVQETEQGAGN